MEGQISQENNISTKSSNLIFLISSILQIVISIAAFIVVFIVLYFTKYGDERKAFFYFVLPFSEIIAIFMPVLFYFLIYKKDYKKLLRLNPLKLKFILPLVVVGLSAQYVGGFLNYLVISLLQLLGRVPSKDIHTPSSIIEVLVMILIIGVLPAIFEELLMRGVILRSYEKYSPKVAILVSALLFGVLHFDLTNFVFPVFLGLILSFVVLKTNSIFSSMIVHFVNNALGVFILFYMPQAETGYYEKLDMASFVQYGLFAMAGSVLMLASLYFISRMSTPQQRLSEINQIETFELKNLFSWPLAVTYVMLLGFFIFNISEIIL